MSRSSTRAAGLAALLLSAALGACQTSPTTTGSVDAYPADLRARHPIVLADAARTLDVFPTGPGHLDPRQAADVQAFLVEYRRYGRGPLVLEAPTGTGPTVGAATGRTVSAIRAMAGAGGVPVAVASYPVGDPKLASAVRLSFRRMQAKVSGECGLWPEDLGTGDYDHGSRNGPYFNFGCATQSNVAAQIADPVDLVRGRREDRIDTIRRAKDIESLRGGKDPSTQWRQDGQSSVKQQVSQ